MHALSLTLQNQPLATPIQGAQLSLEKVDETINCLSISFFSTERGNYPETVRFLLRPVGAVTGPRLAALAREILSNENHGVADVFPLNGTAKHREFKITDFLKKTHRTEIETHLNILKRCDPEQGYARVVVTDFKDVSGRYENRNEISNAERAFVDFFRTAPGKNARVQAEIQRLFKDNRINFFIHEGSLKADLISRAFTPAQSCFLQGTEIGSEILCQLCEVLMNGFKQGCEAAVNEKVMFTPESYLECIQELLASNANTIARFPVVKLMTFYPCHYEETYSDQSRYFQLITNIFLANHYHEQNTTIITITLRAP